MQFQRSCSPLNSLLCFVQRPGSTAKIKKDFLEKGRVESRVRWKHTRDIMAISWLAVGAFIRPRKFLWTFDFNQLFISPSLFLCRCISTSHYCSAPQPKNVFGKRWPEAATSAKLLNRRTTKTIFTASCSDEMQKFQIAQRWKVFAQRERYLLN